MPPVLEGRLARVAGGGSLFFAFSHHLTPLWVHAVTFDSHSCFGPFAFRCDLNSVHFTTLTCGFLGAVRRLSGR